MVEVTNKSDAHKHFGGYVFKPGETKSFKEDDPRLGYFRRHDDYAVAEKKAAKKSSKAAKKD